MADYLTDHDPFDDERVPDLPEWTPEMTTLVLNPRDAQVLRDAGFPDRLLTVSPDLPECQGGGGDD